MLCKKGKFKVMIWLLGGLGFLTCKTPGEAHGLSIFENSRMVSDFMPELWVPDNTYKGSLSDDYQTFYFFRKASPESEKYIPYLSYYKNGAWQQPSIPDYYNESFSYTYQLRVPKTPDLVFLSNLRMKTDTAQKPNYNFWITTISGGRFGEPEELGYNKLIRNYNSQPSISEKGTLYFTSNSPDWSKTYSYKMEARTEGYAEPELFLPVNTWRTNTDWIVYEYCVSPREDYIIVCIEDQKHENSSPDLYISYLEGTDWSLPEKLTDDINTGGVENFPVITWDGKYMIFTRDFSQFKIVPVQHFKK